MERLDLNEIPDRPDLEAAIHCARYAIAKGLVAGKRVLDVACGEGYGSYLLKQAGATSVVGIDIDPPTIERCSRSFTAPGLEFRAANAERLAEIFKAGEFDVVVSIETIEHVEQPEALLRGIKHVLKSDGVAVITCPNDEWYYKDSEITNPFHKTRFSGAKFRALSSGVLGSDAQWSLGTAGLGFVSSPLPVGTGYSEIPNAWFARVDECASYVVATRRGPEVSEETCSYFVGVWGVKKPLSGSALFPLSMDTYASMVRATERVPVEGDSQTLGARTTTRLAALEAEIAAARATSDQERKTSNAQLSELRNEYALVRERLDEEQQKAQQQAREAKIVGLRLSAATSENVLLRERLHTVATELHHANQELHRERAEKVNLRIGHDRYVKLRGLIPRFVRSPVAYSYRGIRKVLRG